MSAVRWKDLGSAMAAVYAERPSLKSAVATVDIGPMAHGSGVIRPTAARLVGLAAIAMLADERLPVHPGRPGRGAT